jgi:D-inositol-3-phosphate glycosyltransferase
MKRTAVLSVHSCPLAALGGKETGGMNVYVREMSREMGRLGYGVDVFTRSQNPHISRVVSLGRNARVIHLKAGPEEPLPKNDLLPHLAEFASEVERFAASERVSYDLIHSHYWLSGRVGEFLKEKWSVPLVHMFHTLGVLKNTLNRRKAEMEPEERIAVEKGIMTSADLLVAPSPWEKDKMIAHYGANPGKISVIPCGVDLSLFRPIPPSRARKNLGLSKRKFVLFVGRIDAIKGIDLLIRAIHCLVEKSCLGKHDLGLIVVGGDKDANPRIETLEMQRLRKMVARLGIEEKVAFWGAQRQDLLPLFYSAAEALILPSRYESFGMVALEAMGCGVPVIASRVGGLQFTVEHGRTGFLFPEGDWRELAERIKEVLLSSRLKKKLGRMALSRAGKFSWPKIARKIQSLYRLLLR